MTRPWSDEEAGPELAAAQLPAGHQGTWTAEVAKLRAEARRAAIEAPAQHLHRNGVTWEDIAAVITQRGAIGNKEAGP
jgi:hypothetical protein